MKITYSKKVFLTQKNKKNPEKSQIRRVNFKNKNKIEPLTPEKACEKFKMSEWSETIINLKKIDSPIKEDFISQSIELQNSMAITEVTINGHLAFGLVAIQNIPQGSKIIYASKEKFKSEFDENDLYALETPQKLFLSASKHGNMARFMNHAPDEERLDTELSFNNKKTLASVATANFKMRNIHSLFFGWNLMYLEAERDIKKGESLYWDYGPNYFLNKNIEEMVLFNKQGKPIDSTKYKWKNPNVFININGRSININQKLYQLLETNESHRFSSDLTDLAHDIIVNTEYFRSEIENNHEVLSQNKYKITIDLPNAEHELIKIRQPETFNQIKENINYIKSITPSILSILLQRDNFNIVKRPDKKASQHGNFTPKIVHFVELKGIDVNILEEIQNKLTENKVFSYIEDKSLYISQLDLFTKLPTTLPIQASNNNLLSTTGMFAIPQFILNDMALEEDNNNVMHDFSLSNVYPL